jgi:hypothetical protein
VRIQAIDVSQEGERRRLRLDLVLPRDFEPSSLVTRIAEVDRVAEVRWTS